MDIREPAPPPMSNVCLGFKKYLFGQYVGCLPPTTDWNMCSEGFDPVPFDGNIDSQSIKEFILSKYPAQGGIEPCPCLCKSRSVS